MTEDRGTPGEGLQRAATEDRGYYGEAYYEYYNGLGPYTRDRWLYFFRQVAAGIVADSAPRTAIEFGCAKGFLTEALRERGVDAWGIDFSPYAVAAAHEAVRDYVRVGDVREPVDRRFDVAICMEVLEHLDERDALTAVRNLARTADTVYFSSNPDEDFPEATHANVQPVEYWERLFAQAGMRRARDFDPSFIAPWALKFEREPVPAEAPVDIVVTVHNSPKQLRWCIDALYRHTDPARFHLLVVDDASDDYTTEVLAGLTRERANARVVRHESNLGYLPSLNEALALTAAPHVVVLNSDAVVTAGWLDRLLAPFAADPAVGLACPLSNNAENLSIAMPPGWSYAETAAHIAERGRRVYPDAVTVVGYCLALSRRLLEWIGPFDPIYAPMYVEEADYQFRALAAGFRAVVVDDCYVYHTQGATQDGRAALEARNWPVFEQRWGPRYRETLARFDAENALGYLRDAGDLSLVDPPAPRFEVVYYLPPTGAGVGGMISVVEIVNRLILQGRRATVASVGPWQVDCECLFAPLLYENEAEFLAYPPAAAVVVATGHQTVDAVVRVCQAYGSVPAYFIQDYEGYFDNGRNLSAVARTYDRIPNRIVVSRWVQDLLCRQHGLVSALIPLGVAVDDFYPRRGVPRPLARLRAAGQFLVFAMLRGDDRRGAAYLVEAARRLNESHPEITFVFAGRYATTSTGEDYALPECPNVVGVGLLTRDDMARYLAACDAAVDASLYQGFGMLGIEALAAGAAAVLTRTGGALEYARDGENCLLVAPRDVRGLCDALVRLRAEPALVRRLAQAGRETALQFDWADLAARHAAFFEPLQAQARPADVPARPRRARQPRPATAGLSAPASVETPEPVVTLWRGIRAGEHFYSADPGELARAGYVPEGRAFTLYERAADGRLPVYRAYHRRSGDHLYSANREEIARTGYRSEGIVGYVAVAAAGDDRPLYRLRHPGTGDRLYGLDRNEGSGSGYRLEGAVGFVPCLPAAEPAASPPWPAPSAQRRVRQRLATLARRVYHRLVNIGGVR